jgi:hypothetical protein
MLFNSLQFALFFPSSRCIYFALPHGGAGTMLLLASCVFYMGVRAGVHRHPRRHDPDRLRRRDPDRGGDGERGAGTG